MRRWLTAAAVAALTLALAGAAMAAFVQHSTVKLTAAKAGQSAGITANIYSHSDPGKAPRAAKRVTVTFPSGTKFNLALKANCTISDSQVAAGKTCPASSKIGTGSAAAKAYPLPQTFTGGVGAYVAGKTKMLLIASVKGQKPLAIHVKVQSSKLIIAVPSPVVLGFKVILTGLRLNVPKSGTGKHALITAGKCTQGKFAVKTHFVYADGAPLDITTTSPCR
ncbi:MAG: hypothetical protein ACYCXW_01885 [Solirubrobacteraceae bacterium]